MRKVFLIAWSVLIESIRRKEIYVIVMAACLIIAITGSIRFFDIEGINKFYRDISLKVMNLATALTVIVLAARQLPREFENRTIYPLLAKPVGRFTFLIGKLAGVLAAGFFCYLLFVSLFLAGMKYLGVALDPILFVQAIYLQFLAMAVLATMAFFLSLLFNIDAAITVTVLLFVLGGTLTAALDYVYDFVKDFGIFEYPWLGNMVVRTSLGDLAMRTLNYAVPQLTLLDLSSKVVHENAWLPLPSIVLIKVTQYAGIYCFIYGTMAWCLFRRKPL